MGSALCPIPPQGKAIPPSERLGEYPLAEVALPNTVAYPPQVEVIPVKPIFLDVAWNYIEYPDKAGKTEARGKEKAADTSSSPEKPQKRGWFGFGR